MEHFGNLDQTIFNVVTTHGKISQNDNKMRQYTSLKDPMAEWLVSDDRFYCTIKGNTIMLWRYYENIKTVRICKIWRSQNEYTFAGNATVRGYVVVYTLKSLNNNLLNSTLYPFCCMLSNNHWGEGCLVV